MKLAWSAAVLFTSTLAVAQPATPTNPTNESSQTNGIPANLLHGVAGAANGAMTGGAPGAAMGAANGMMTTPTGAPNAQPAPAGPPADAPVAQVAPLTPAQTACITLTRKAAGKICTALDKSSNAAPVMQAAIAQEKEKPGRIAAEFLPQAESAAQALVQGDAVLHKYWCGLMSADAEAVTRCSANPAAWSSVIDSDIGALRELKMQVNGLTALSASTVYQSQYKQVESTLAGLKSDLENSARAPSPQSALPGNPLATGR